MSDFTPDDATAFRPSDSRPSSPQHRFAPGAVVSERYRIISMVGAGGMGEVYRADDLKLGQQVALKFLPRNIAQSAVERLYAEVRVGRQISHPNVCRLYDVGEAAGHHFLTMEFVDGEDLASLLRRIGRLPSDKAVAIARDICAGLAASHDKGVVHRDLKPANIMVDGRGSARVTDFGLAIAAESDTSHELAGTPAYMSPEQLNGGAATVRSDIYALALVLYEIFTGRRLFTGRSLDELREQHTNSKTRPSSVISEMDPAIERLILRCLEEDPAERPPSMQAVMAALPGGDPLQAAIAAGETPSPQMVAAAGESGQLAPARAWLILGAFVLSLFVLAVANDHATLLGYVDGVRSRDALRDRARTLVTALGYQSGSDDAAWYSSNVPYVTTLRKKGAAALKAAAPAAPGALLFSYRERQGELVPLEAFRTVSISDPAPVVPGDTFIELDHQGRLRQFSRVPPHEVATSPAAFDWTPLLRETGIDLSSLKETSPSATPPVASDRRYAWTAAFPHRDDQPVRIEAATFGGRPVFFRLAESAAPVRPQAQGIGRTVFSLVAFTVFVGGAILARRNTARGRGDVSGARRVGVAIAATFGVSYMTSFHHVTDASAEYDIFVDIVGLSLYSGLMAFLAYLAVEPYVRRRWPKVLIASSRVLAGRWRDPLAGRELLIGIAIGTALLAVCRIIHAAAVVGGVANPSNPLVLRVFSGPMPAFALISYSLANAAMYSLGLLALALILRAVFRKTRIVLVALPIVYAAMSVGSFGWVDFVNGLLVGVVATVVVFRRSALTHWAATFTLFILRSTPLTLGFEEAFAPIALTVVATLLAIASLAFHVSLAGAPVFGTIAVEDEAVAQ